MIDPRTPQRIADEYEAKIASWLKQTSGWQLIETAPRETPVIIGRADWQMFPVAKFGPYGDGEDGPFDGWLFLDEFTNLCLSDSGEPFLGYAEDPMPTHWLRLPPEVET